MLRRIKNDRQDITATVQCTVPVISDKKKNLRVHACMRFRRSHSEKKKKSYFPIVIRNIAFKRPRDIPRKNMRVFIYRQQ